MLRRHLGVLVVLLLAPGVGFQPAHAFIRCCHVHSSPPWLAGWTMVAPTEAAAESTFERLGFFVEPGSAEWPQLHVPIVGGGLSWMESSPNDVGIPTTHGAPRLMQLTVCAGDPFPGPPARVLAVRHPNAALAVARVTAVVANLDSACRTMIFGSSWVAPPCPLRFGSVFEVEGLRAREASLEYGGIIRLIEDPSDQLGFGASGWIGLTLLVDDLAATARCLEARAVSFARATSPEGPMIRVPPEEVNGVFMEFVSER